MPRTIQKLFWSSAVLRKINLGIACTRCFDMHYFAISTGACGSSRHANKLWPSCARIPIPVNHLLVRNA